MSFTGKRYRLLFIAFILLALGAASCASGLEEIKVSPEEMKAYLADKPQPLHPIFEKVLRQGARNRVLHLNQAGVASMQLGEYELARRCFEESVLLIEAVFADTEKAQKARSLWREEKSKDFKGEPYERAMAFYYLGLLDMMDGDYENARASFKSGILQDAFVDDEQENSDFALLMFLEAWCSQQLGDRGAAAERYREVKQNRPWFTPPPKDHNCLVLVETGDSPVKAQDGKEKSMLRFFRAKTHSEQGATITVGGKTEAARAIEDLYYQASTRGGRQMDGLLEGQVKFKEINAAVGSVLTQGGFAAMQAGLMNNNSDLAAVGAVVALFGIAQQVMASAVKPTADVRHWTNLPDKVHVLTCKLSTKKKRNRRVRKELLIKEKDKITVNFLNDSGTPIRSADATVHLIKEGRGGLVWVKDRSAVKEAFIDQ